MSSPPHPSAMLPYDTDLLAFAQQQQQTAGHLQQPLPMSLQESSLSWQAYCAQQQQHMSPPPVLPPMQPSMYQHHHQQLPTRQSPPLLPPMQQQHLQLFQPQYAPSQEPATVGPMSQPPSRHSPPLGLSTTSVSSLQSLPFATLVESMHETPLPPDSVQAPATMPAIPLTQAVTLGSCHRCQQPLDHTDTVCQHCQHHFHNRCAHLKDNRCKLCRQLDRTVKRAEKASNRSVASASPSSSQSMRRTASSVNSTNHVCMMCSQPMHGSIANTINGDSMSCSQCRRSFHMQCGDWKQTSTATICRHCQREPSTPQSGPTPAKRHRRERSEIPQSHKRLRLHTADDDSKASHSLPVSLSATPIHSRVITPADTPRVHAENFEEFLSVFVNNYSSDDTEKIPYKSSATSQYYTGDWCDLSNHVRKANQQSLLSSIPVELMDRLVPFLVTAIDAGSTTLLLSPPTPIDDTSKLSALRAFDGAVMAMTIITAPSISRLLIRDELIDGCVRLLIHTVKRSLLPAFDSHWRDKLRDIKSSKTPSKDEIKLTNDSESKENGTANDSSGDARDYWRSIKSQLKDLSSKTSSLLTLLTKWAGQEVSHDRHALPLIDIVFVILGTEDCRQLQMASIPLILNLFIHGHVQDARRSSILQSLIEAFRLSAHRKIVRSYPLPLALSTSFRSLYSPLTNAGADIHVTSARNDSSAKVSSIQMLVAVLMQLMQSIAVTPIKTKNDSELHITGTDTTTGDAHSGAMVTISNDSIDMFTETLQSLGRNWFRTIGAFVKELLITLQPGAASGILDYKLSEALIRAIIDDLLLVLYLPEWPVSEIILRHWVSCMCSWVTEPDKAASDELKSERFQRFAVRLLGIICQQVTAHRVQVERAPLVIRPERQLFDPSATPESADEVTDCVCGTRKVGRWNGEDGDDVDTDPSQVVAHAASVAEKGFFIDCDSCHVWFHAECVGLLHRTQFDNTQWFCESCQLRKAVEAQNAAMERKAFTKLEVQRFHQSIEDDYMPPNKQNEDCDSTMGALDSKEEYKGPLVNPLTSKTETRASSSVLKQLLLNYLSSLLDSNDESCLYARQFHLSSWVFYLTRERELRLKNLSDSGIDSSHYDTRWRLELKLLALNWPPPSLSDSVRLSLPTLEREAEIRLCRQLSFASGSLMGQVSAMLDLLLVKCMDPQPKSRALAVNSVAGIIKVDPKLLHQQTVSDVLSARVLDTSILTRESVIDLIGSQIKYQPSILAQYYPTIIGRATDVGVSVRKRVVKILQEILLHPSIARLPEVQARYSDIIVKLIERADDDDALQKLIHDTFKHLWFAAEMTSHRHRNTAVIHTERKTADDETDNSKFTPEFHSLVHNIVDSCASVTRLPRGFEKLQELIRGLMDDEELPVTKKRGKRSGDSGSMDVEAVREMMRAKPNSIRNVCADICTAIVEHLVKFSPEPVQRSQSQSQSQGHAASAEADDVRKTHYVSTLHLFCHIHPTFILSHEYSLEPYLHWHSDRYHWSTVEKLAEIFIEIVPLLKNSHQHFRLEMERDLKSILSQSKSVSLIAAATTCLVLFSITVTNNKAMLLTIMKKFYDFLNKLSQANQFKFAVNDEGNIIRCLTTMGLFYKYWDVEGYAGESDQFAPSTETVFQLYNRFATHCYGTPVGNHAVKGMIALFTRAPKLIIHSQSVLTRALDSVNAMPELQKETLSALRQFLFSEDQRLQRAQKLDQSQAMAENRIDSQSVTDETADAADQLAAVNALHSFHSNKKNWLDSRIDSSDFLPALVTSVEHQSLSLCFSSSDAVRQEALSFVSLYLHQGVNMPMEALGTMIAALTDRTKTNAVMASQTLSVFIAKRKEHIKFVEQRFVVGLEMAYRLQHTSTATHQHPFDPLHAWPWQDADGDPLQYDSVPGEQLSQLYATLAKKSSNYRKSLASQFVNDVMVGQLRLGGITASSGGGVGPSQSPVPAQSPVTTSLSSPSSSLPSSIVYLPPGCPPTSSMAKFGFLCFVAELISLLPFEEDECLHLSAHLSKIISVKGTQLHSTIEAIQNELMASLDELSDGQRHSKVAELSELSDASLGLSVLMHLYCWIQFAYGLDSGKYEAWTVNANAKAFKVSKKPDEPLRFDLFPWTEKFAEDDSQAAAQRLAESEAQATPTLSKRGRGGKGRGGRCASMDKSAQTAEARLEALLMPSISAQLKFFMSMFVEVELMESGAIEKKKRGGGKKKVAVVWSSDSEVDSGDDAESPVKNSTKKRTPARRGRGSRSKASRSRGLFYDGADASASGRKTKRAIKHVDHGDMVDQTEDIDDLDSDVESEWDQ